MARQYNLLPEFHQTMQDNGQNSTVWHRFFAGLIQGRAPGAESKVKVTASPFSYKAPSAGFLIVQGGTVSLVSLTRNATYPFGTTQGHFPVSQDDIITITYSAAPTVTFVPQ